MPPGRIARSAFSNVSCRPSASIATSTPRPSVSRLISGDRIAVVGVERDVGAEARAPSRAARRTESMPMISAAPLSFAPSVAHRPIGPCAKTATASPTLMLPLSAPQRPVEKMSGHSSTSSSVELVGNRREVGARVGHEQVLGPRAVDGVAEAPAAERAAALRVRAVQAVEALAARRDRADDDALADRVVSSRPAPSSSMTPTGSCPRTSPGLTGYSPRTMCTSVPQIVVVVMRMTASPASGAGFGTSSTAMLILALEYDRFHGLHGNAPLTSHGARLPSALTECSNDSG